MAVTMSNVTYKDVTHGNNFFCKKKKKKKTQFDMWHVINDVIHFCLKET